MPNRLTPGVGVCLQALPALQAQLHAQLTAQGVDVAALLRPSTRQGTHWGGDEDPEDSDDPEPTW